MQRLPSCTFYKIFCPRFFLGQGIFLAPRWEILHSHNCGRSRGLCFTALHVNPHPHREHIYQHLAQHACVGAQKMYKKHHTVQHRGCDLNSVLCSSHPPFLNCSPYPRKPQKIEISAINKKFFESQFHCKGARFKVMCRLCHPRYQTHECYWGPGPRAAEVFRCLILADVSFSFPMKSVLLFSDPL